MCALHLDDNKLGPKFAAAASSMIRSNRTLTALHLSRCGLTDAAVVQLGNALQTNAALQHLDLSWNDARAPGLLPPFHFSVMRAVCRHHRLTLGLHGILNQAAWNSPRWLRTLSSPSTCPSIV